MSQDNHLYENGLFRKISSLRLDSTSYNLLFVQGLVYESGPTFHRRPKITWKCVGRLEKKTRRTLALCVTLQSLNVLAGRFCLNSRNLQGNSFLLLRLDPTPPPPFPVPISSLSHPKNTRITKNATHRSTYEFSPRQLLCTLSPSLGLPGIPSPLKENGHHLPWRIFICQNFLGHFFRNTSVLVTT